MRLPRQFPVRFTRVEGIVPVQIEATVTGYYIGKKGKAEFVAEKVTINGLPGADPLLCSSKEIEELKKYALSVEYPKMLGLKV
jgi:hypothetical protein